MIKSKTKRMLTVIASTSLIIGLVAALIVSFATPASALTSIADDSTITSWENTTGNNTKNIGRIWTDKTVSTSSINLQPVDLTVEKNDDEDFLIALSALSSAAKITGETSVPLDIVLVLDTSGSMADSIVESSNYSQVLNTSDNYSDAYSRRNNLYVLDNGVYYKLSVTRARDGFFSYRYTISYTVNGEIKYLAENAQDANLDTTLYALSTTTTTKMTALKNAVNSFIDKTAEMNSSIANSNDKHRISIVTYSSSANIQQQLTVCDDSNISRLKRTINGLTANGATGADYAMDKTIESLDSARDDAKKIVVFFTDGEPNHYNGFDNTVANAAINKAKNLKDTGALMYSIGVFDNADPSDTASNFNAYMHGMSSNYPNATSYTNLGQRATDKNGQPTQYYKAATNSSELNNIFDEIASDISEQAASSPTDMSQGSDSSRGGYITFTDELGSYMQVSSFKSIVFADKEYKLSRTESNGDTDTYIFDYDVEGNVVYPNGDLSNILITVQKSQTDKQGDIVTVQIPANLIPLRYYDVDINKEGKATTKITEAYPLRVFYGVKLKDGMQEKLANPDSELQQYIDDNKDENGNVKFYANAWNKDGSGDSKVTAEFTPATTNDFYYFVQDKTLYTDEECTQVAKAPVDTSGNTKYYYQRTYYEVGKEDPQINTVEVPGDSNLIKNAHIETDAEGNLYVPKGSPRLTSLYYFRQDKESNSTGTESYVSSPTWKNLNNTRASGNSSISVGLGNNGVMGIELPGKLTVSKTVENAEGHQAPENDKFTFTLNLSAPANSELAESYKAQIFDKNNEKVGEEFTIKSGDTFELQNGQTINVYGIEAGTGYTVTETNKTGYTANATNERGSINAGEISVVSFVNKYKAEPVTVKGDTAFKAQKSYNAWENVPETFEFVMQALDNAPLPEGTAGNAISKEVPNGDIFNFGDIEYTKPGTYEYSIYENTPKPGVAGISYSEAAYKVIVTVADNNGKLEATTVMTQTHGDGGEDVNLPIENNVAVIKNEFRADSEKVGPLATKKYTDYTGSKPLQSGMFEFKMKALNGGPLPADMKPDSNGYVYVTNSADTIALGQIEFTAKQANQTFEYEVSEVTPENPINGMTYDDTVYIVKMNVGVKEINEVPTVVVETIYCDANGNPLSSDQLDNGRLVFKNSYKANSVILSGETAIKGSKTLVGRDMKDNESFKFELSAADESTEKAINDKSVIIPKDSATVTNAKNSQPAGFSFEDIEFSKVGTYVFNIKEIDIPNENGNGMTYDRNIDTVKVIVKDNNGQLEAEVVYNDGSTQQAEFVNEYKASISYGYVGGLKVSKKLTGRTMEAEEFTFTIAKEGTEGPDVASNDAQFTNSRRGDGSAYETTKLSTLNFTQDDAGKTYYYIVDEIEPTDDENINKTGIQKNGVTYDQSQYRVAIHVSDNGDGTLDVTTTITKIKNSDGVEVNEKVEAGILFENTYAPDQPAVLDGATNLKVEKLLVGRDENNSWLETDEFKFKLDIDENDEETVNALNNGNIILPDNHNEIKITGKDSVKEAAFGNITFTKAGTYKFIVNEIDDNKIPGIAYSSEIKRIEIVVSDNLDGSLSATKGSNSDTLFFQNTYSIDNYILVGATNLKVTKVLEGRDWQSGDSFSFVLSGNDDVTNTAIENNYIELPDNADGITITNNDETKSAAFGNITINKPGTYKFSISEDKSDLINGITYADAKEITVTATDNGDGTLDVSVLGNDDLTFTNTYTPNEATLNGEANLKVTKVIDGRDWLDTDEFSFKLELADNETVFAKNDGKVILSNSTLTINKENKDSASFGDITFKEAGTYKFTVSEVNGSIPGVKYDTTSKTITVKVVDNKDGTMSATIVADESDDLTFTNKYTPNPVSIGATDLAVTKELKGREWIDTDVFIFNIAAGNTVTENAVEAKEITFENTEIEISKANLVARFGEITFTKTGDYLFKVTEKPGNIKGITYDSSEKYIAVSVTDDNNGSLVATINNGPLLVFENTYAPVDSAILKGETNLKVTKNLTGREDNKWSTRDIYIFDLKPDTADTATAEAYNNGNIILGDSSLIVNSGNKDSASFGDITFKTAGTYKFTVSEVDTKVPGVTYDTTPKTIVVNVTDNLDGTLSATIDTENSETLEFNNVYKPSEAVLEGSTALKVTKNFTGRDWLDSEFTFNLTAGDTTTQEAVTAGKVILDNGSLTINEGNKDSASFGNIRFTEAGTYKFTVSEVNGNIPGVSYDTTPKTIIVNVVDNNNGELVATIDKESNTLTFNNSYTPSATTLVGSENLQVTKTFTGRADNAWLDTDEFRFVITAKDTATIDAVNAGEIILPGDLVINSKDSASFGDITFTKAGTYTFSVSEVEGNIPGVTYDKTSKTITVNVVDRNDGTMEATLVEGSDSLAFNNTYAPAQTTLDGSTNLKVTKNFTGRVNNEWRNDDIFGFILAADENDPATKEALDQKNIILPENTTLVVTNTNKDNAYFDGITFKAVGTYKFTIRETKGNTAGVSYDESVKNIIVQVTDDNTGVLKASVIDGSDALTFNNTYAPLPVTLDAAKNLVVTKEFTGRVNNQWLDTDVFTFNLTATGDTLKAVEAGDVRFLGNTEVEINKNSNNTASFGNIEFTKPGEYTFKVNEVDGKIPGVTYDLADRVITVKAVDNNDGSMSVSVEGNDDLTFSNVYRTENVILDGKGNLNVTKVLAGRNWNDTDSFKFELKASDEITKAAVEAGKIELPETTLTLTKVLQTNNFGDITFKEPGTYTFEISEVNENIERVGYDSHVITISVEVTDNNEGKLVVATPTVTGEMTFTNTYTPAPVTATLQGTKVMSGRDLKDSDKFSFTIEGINNAPMPQVPTVENNKNSISFAPITYREAGTYEYTIKETGGSAASVTNDSGIVKATVKVTYDMDTGILTPDVTYVKEGGNGEGFTFTNKYEATPIVLANGFSATKTVKPTDGNKYDIKGGEFEFMITPSQNNPTSDPIKENTVTNDVNGKIIFATDIKYTEAGTYVYDVKEVSGNLGGMSYDDTIYTITVKVTDNQTEGRLEAEVSTAIKDNSVDSIKFTNGYNPKAATAIISGKKVLDGKELAVDAFTFNIETTNNAPMPEKTSVTNSATGVVQFDEITYDRPGEYHYQISEVNDGNEGYTYDSDVKDVTVKVTDVNGELKSEIINNEFEFNNIYKAKSVIIGGNSAQKIEAVKKLDGRKLNDKEFEFELLDQNGTVVATATNDTKGNLYFSEIEFEEVGTYYFTMIEKNNNLGGVTYDQNTYLLEVVVTDEGGHLGAKIRYIGVDNNNLDTVVFNNSYKAAATSIQLGATKMLNGRDLKADEFTFVLKDKDGKVVSEALNTANGLIQFDKLNFDEVGTYQYTIAEVSGSDETVTYDNSVFTATVNVTDDGKGNLNAEVVYDKTPVFTNEVKAKDPSSVETDDKYGYEYLGALTISMLGGMALYAQRKKRVIK